MLQCTLLNINSNLQPLHRPKTKQSCCDTVMHIPPNNHTILHHSTQPLVTHHPFVFGTFGPVKLPPSPTRRSSSPQHMLYAPTSRPGNEPKEFGVRSVPRPAALPSRFAWLRVSVESTASLIADPGEWEFSDRLCVVRGSLGLGRWLWGRDGVCHGLGRWCAWVWGTLSFASMMID